MRNVLRMLLGWGSFLVSVPVVQAIDLHDTLSVEGVLAGAVQCQSSTADTGMQEVCKSALPFQPEISFHPSAANEFFMKLGLAVGNGLSQVTPYQISSWAVDMAEDVTDINGSGRDYLLTAWYRHRFTFSPRNRLVGVIGIIDATEYLDENAYANDPYTQFMNAALTSGPNTFFPSYDLGGALLWDIGRWSFHAVAMDVSQNVEGNEYTFYGLEVGYRLETPLGKGNYRVLIDGTSNDFLDVVGINNAQHHFLIFSFDQALGDTLGAFLRFGWQDGKATINYRDIYSGGLEIKGRGWGRQGDNIGVGFAYLVGGNQSISQTRIAEAYYRLAVVDAFSLTADLQYMHDTLKHGEGAGGFIYGLRVVTAF